MTDNRVWLWHPEPLPRKVWEDRLTPELVAELIERRRGWWINTGGRVLPDGTEFGAKELNDARARQVACWLDARKWGKDPRSVRMRR